MVDGEDIGERRPSKYAEGDIDLGGLPHAVHQAAHPRRTGGHQQDLARRSFGPSVQKGSDPFFPSL